MKFPVTIEHRSQKAVIYGRTANYDYYRVASRSGGRRTVRNFRTFGEAKAYAQRTVRDLAKGNQSTALTPKEATDALACREVLDDFFRDTGRRVRTLEAVKAYTDALRKLGDHTMEAAVSGFLSTAAAVQRKDLAEAIEEFITSQEPLTKPAKEGERPQVSEKWHYNRAICLRKFASVFQSIFVCDLAKDHIDLFLGSLGKMKSRSPNRRPVGSAKSRNHYRACLRQFFGWAVRRDYIAPTHRLMEAETMRPERGNGAEVQFYTPTEFRKLLDAAQGSLQALIAIGGLAGLRTAELLRLDWQDVWRVRGHIEISQAKAKSRQRRLVPVCKSLAAWLAPFRQLKQGRIWEWTESEFHVRFRELCQHEDVNLERKDNGLRHSFCTYAFVKHGEIETAQMAGNSPTMIHTNYKGLATKAEATRWFNVRPAKTDGKIIPVVGSQSA